MGDIDGRDRDEDAAEERRDRRLEREAELEHAGCDQHADTSSTAG